MWRRVWTETTLAMSSHPFIIYSRYLLCTGSWQQVPGGCCAPLMEAVAEPQRSAEQGGAPPCCAPNYDQIDADFL